MKWEFDVAGDPYTIEWFADPPRVVTDNEAVEIALRDVLTLPTVTGPPQPTSIVPSYGSAVDAWLTVYVVLADLEDAGLVENVAYPDNPMPLADGDGIDGAPDEIGSVAASAAVFGGKGSGPRPGHKSPWYERGSKAKTSVDRIRAKSDELRAILDLPLGARSGGEADTSGQLLAATESGMKPGPMLKKAERLVRSIGKAMNAEIGKRAGVDLEALAEDYTRAAVATIERRADWRKAKRLAVNEMIAGRYGSVEEAEKQLGDEAYDELRVLLETKGLAQVDAQLEGRAMVQAPGESAPSLWTFDPSRWAAADSALSAAQQDARRAERELHSAEEAWSASAVQLVDEIRGLNRPDSNPVRSDIERVGRQSSSLDVQEKWNEASRKLPDDWVLLSNHAGGPQLKTLVRDDISRASASKTVVRVSPSNRPDVYAHEFVHRLQHQDKKWLALDYAFLERRAGRDRAVPLQRVAPNSGYEADEVTRRDKLPDPYVGKVYPDYDGTGIPFASEVSSMGVQAYVRGDLPTQRQQLIEYREYPKTGGYGTTREVGEFDLDFVNYTLGVVATQGRLL